MAKFVVYEVWTKARVIEAEDEHDAYTVGEPAPPDGDLSLCNWHVVPLTDREEQPWSGGLNYRQV